MNANDQTNDRIALLENVVRELMQRMASFGNFAGAFGGGGAAVGNPVGLVPLAEPVPRMAFSVRWNEQDKKWQMYLPADCLLCDGKKPGGIFDTGEEYDIPEEWNGIGIKAQWKVNKKTGEVIDPIADISNSLEASSKIVDPPNSSSYSVEFNFPVAKIVDNEVVQITCGYVSLTSHRPAKDGKLTIKDSSGNTIGTFTANQEQDVTVAVSTAAPPNDGKLKVQFGSDSAVDKFSANQSGDSTLSLAKIASTGSYNDLSDKPTIPQPIQPNDGKLKVKFGSDAATDKFSANQAGDSTLELAKVASTGSYNDLSDKPTIPTPLSGTVKFVGENGIRYDVSTRQIQIRVDTLNLATGAVTPGSWAMITGGQAVPLQSENS